MMIYLWLGLIVFSIILEANTNQMVSIWFVFGGVAGLITNLIGLLPQVQVLIAAIVTLLCLIFTRPLVKRKLEVKPVGTNADRYIGEKAIVIAEINNIVESGQVKVKGSVWTARADQDAIIEEGEIVKVLRIEGVKLIVEPIQG